MEKNKFTEIYLIRHGETEYNQNKIYMGHIDIPLNEKGRIQSEKIRKELENKDIDFIFSSDLKRCKETAKIINKEKDKIITEYKELREFDFGIFDGKTYRELLEQYPKEYSKWMKNWKSNKIKNGESIKIFEKRVLGIFKSILNKKEHEGKKTAIVTHGGVIKIILAKYYGKGIDNFWNLKIDNGKWIKLNFLRDKFICLDI